MKVNKKTKICDFCGNKIIGEVFPVYDENYNKQKGLHQCSTCFGKSL
jgi:hypothetical protein